MSIIIERSKLLLVEGKDEVNFFDSLINDLGLVDIQIIDFGGKTNYRANIRALPNIPKFDLVDTIGITRDADNADPINAFQSIRSSLIAANLPLPPSINTFTTTPVSIGIFILPDNLSHGMLEDLCLRTIEDDPIERCINTYLNCANPDVTGSSKAKVQCYLAAQEPIVNSLGLGAKASHWNFNSDKFDQIKTFLFHFNRIQS